MKFKTLALCASIALVSACGGGGSTPPPTNGGPTPSPSPSPSPAPVQYSTFDDLTGDQTFDAACAEGANSDFFTNVITAFDEDFTISFSEAAQTWTIEGESREGPLSASFGPNDITSEDPGVLVLYQRPSSTGSGPSDIFAFGTPQWPTASAEYVRGAFIQTQRADGSVAAFNCVFGVPTTLEDELPTEIVTYNDEFDVAGTLVSFGGTATNPVITSYDLSPTLITITGDPNTLEVSFDVQLRGFEFSFDPTTGDRVTSTDITELGTYTGEAFVSDEGRQTLRGGNLFNQNPTGQQLAPVTGWFFGPQGIELGLAFTGSEDNTSSGGVSFSFGVTARQDP